MCKQRLQVDRFLTHPHPQLCDIYAPIQLELQLNAKIVILSKKSKAVMDTLSHYVILCTFESNWYKRTTKEAIAIKRIKPTLNEDEGRYISPIFDPVPSKFTRSRLVSQADDVTSDGFEWC